MSLSLESTLKTLFPGRPDIYLGLTKIASHPEYQAVVSDLAEYISALKSTVNGDQQQSNGKKRKLDGQSIPDIGGSLVFSVPDVSFSMPVRKKLKLEGVHGGIKGIDASGNQEVSLPWQSIDYIFCLAVPEKAKPQYNFVIIPKLDSGMEPTVWTAPDANAKTATADQGPHALAKQIDTQLEQYSKRVIWAQDSEFASAGATGKGPKSHGVRAHRGSKEGYLFFLGPGILWAFKKPLLFLPFHAITSISYTSVLQRTYNLVVNAREPGADSESEIEYSMLDQATFAGIDGYIKRHELNDASLADKRRAKMYNVNAPRGSKTTGEQSPTSGAAAGEESELQRAERELQEREDAEEEDYADDSGSGEDGESSSDGEHHEDLPDDDSQAEILSDEVNDLQTDGSDGEDEALDDEYDREKGGYEDEG